MDTVSIIIPCYNEEKTIGLLLSALLQQTYPCQDLEVVIADGLSTDQTRAAILTFQSEHPQMVVKLVDNPRRNIPAALNIALEASTGKWIIRLDAHSTPAPDYVERCVAALQRGDGDVVGGVWQIEPGAPGWIARSIAHAAAHPFGVGDALYRFTTRAAAVDTVPFGAFNRALFERVGKFDESLLTNEDYELNTRVRQQGGRIWLDPAIRSRYFARSSLQALARQYFRYGYWKQRMLRRYPATLRWRQALPPLFVLALAALLVLASFWNVARILLLLQVGLYLLALLAGALPIALKQKDLRLLAGIPLAISTMHLSWGSGFWVSLLNR